MQCGADCRSIKALDSGPRGLWFEILPGHRLLWPLASHISTDSWVNDQDLNASVISKEKHIHTSDATKHQ